MTKKLARPTNCSFRKLDARTDAEGAPIRTYEVRSGDLILGTVCGDSDGTWYAEAGLGGSAEPLSTEGKAMRFPTRSHAAEVLRAFVVGRAEHLAEREEKVVIEQGGDFLVERSASRGSQGGIGRIWGERSRAMVLTRSEAQKVLQAEGIEARLISAKEEAKAEKLGKVLAGSTWWHHAEPAPKTLAELREAIIAEKIHPMDMVKLPTFGGTEPESMHGVFSWDATHILTQDRTGWAIVERSDFDADPAQVEVSLGQRSGSPTFRASQADVEEAVRVLVASMVPTAEVLVSSRNDDGADRVHVDGDFECSLAREIKDRIGEADWEAEQGGIAADAPEAGLKGLGADGLTPEELAGLEPARKYVHAMGSDGCLTVCGEDADDSAVASDQLHTFGDNACPACTAACAEEHKAAFPNGCGETWSTMCPDCCNRLGAKFVPRVHLGPARWETACGSTSESWTANPAAVTCPDCVADEVRMAAGKANYARLVDLHDAEELVYDALDRIPSRVDRERDNLAIAQMLWRLVDAATLLARLVPKADVGLQTLTGRGGLLVVADVSNRKQVAGPPARPRTGAPSAR